MQLLELQSLGGTGTQGDEGGADVLTVGEGRQALDVDSEQARERIRLGITELWELGRDVLHRAMALAQLHSDQGRALTHGSGGGGVTVGSQLRCQYLGPGSDVVACCRKLFGAPLLEIGNPPTGELSDSLCAGVLGEESQRRGGHVVVVAAHADVTGLRQDVGTGGPATSSTTSIGRLVLFDVALLDEQVQVTADRGGRQPQTGGQGGCGNRAVLGDRPQDPVPGACLENVRREAGLLRTVRDGVVCDKHKDSVT